MNARGVAWAAVAAAVLHSGCASYASYVRGRCRSWESTHTWNSEGVRQGCEPRRLGRGDTALLMVHGFGDNPSVWKPMMEDFAARGYHCRALRLPGFGDRLEARKRVTRAAWLSTVDDELQRLGRTHREVWLVAHSMGAAVSIHRALEQPEQVSGLVLLAPLLEVSKARSPLLSPRTWHELLGGVVPITETPFKEDLFKPPPPDRAPVDRFITGNINHEMFALLDEIHPRAEQLGVPLFMAVSPNDQVASPEAAAAWYRRATQAPRSELFRAEKSAHVLPLDHDAQSLAEAIDHFITDTGTRLRPR